MPDVLIEKQDGIVIMTFNRPERLNALPANMSPSLRELIGDIGKMEDARALVVTGAGRAFCAGAEMATLKSHDARKSDMGVNFLRRQDAGSPGPFLFTQLRIPVVGAINGPAVGAGAEIALSTDYRVAGESARIGFVFPMRGVVPDAGVGTWLLPRIVGLSKAAYITLSGEILDASKLLELGLVDRVVSDDRMLNEAIAVARTMGRGAPLAVQETKRLLYQGLERTPAEHTPDNQGTLRRLMLTEDFQEGVRSFIEKRAPVWAGR